VSPASLKSSSWTWCHQRHAASDASSHERRRPSSHPSTTTLTVRPEIHCQLVTEQRRRAISAGLYRRSCHSLARLLHESRTAAGVEPATFESRVQPPTITLPVHSQNNNQGNSRPPPVLCSPLLRLGRPRTLTPFCVRCAEFGNGRR